MQKRLLLWRTDLKFGLIWLHIFCRQSQRKGCWIKVKITNINAVSSSHFIGVRIVCLAIFRAHCSLSSLDLVEASVTNINGGDRLQNGGCLKNHPMSISPNILACLKTNNISFLLKFFGKCAFPLKSQLEQDLLQRWCFPKEVDLVYYLFNFYDTSLRLAGRNIRGFKKVMFLKISFLKMFVCKN